MKKFVTHEISKCIWCPHYNYIGKSCNKFCFSNIPHGQEIDKRCKLPDHSELDELKIEIKSQFKIISQLKDRTYKEAFRDALNMMLDKIQELRNLGG